MGVWVLRKLVNGRAEFLSLWESFDAIRKFAGAEIDKAVYYPEDEKFLLELDLTLHTMRSWSSPEPSHRSSEYMEDYKARFEPA
jgi:hypothetical protein